jgi:hypothetical protein
MTQSDMLAARAAGTSAAYDGGDKRVVPDGHVTTILLHGHACMTIRRDRGTLTIDGRTPATRKSCRLMNAVLGTFGAGNVHTRKGRWYHRSADGTLATFSGAELTLPMLF